MFSLRLGHLAVLTVPRTVIHCRSAASLPFTREPVEVTASETVGCGICYPHGTPAGSGDAPARGVVVWDGVRTVRRPVPTTSLN